MASGSTTVGALPYPLSTDAPSVHTDIQALAQALANRLTSPTSHGASATLSDGELAVSTASPITLTLPSAAANARVGVFAKVVTATNPVTVSSGSSNIYGIGLNGVSSFTLGIVGAFIVLVSDGTNWYVVDGQRDTGWVGVTPAGNTTVSTTGLSAYPMATRIRGDRVECRGFIQLNAGFVGSTICTVASGHAPQYLVEVPVMATHSSGAVLAGIASVDTTGGVSVGTSAGSLSTGDIFEFDAVSYPWKL